MARHADPDRSGFYRSLAAAAGKVLIALLVVGGVALVAVNLTGSGVDLVGGEAGDQVTDPIAVPTEDGLVDPDDVIDTDGIDDERLDVDGAEEPTDEPLDEPTADAPTEEGTTPPLFDPDATEQPTIEEEAPEEEPTEESGINPNDVSVQVLDGGAGEAKTQDAIDTLEEMGYQVLAISTARPYETTTVLYGDGYEGIAEDLRSRDERFAEVGPNPNLTEDVLIHVVVASDWPE